MLGLGGAPASKTLSLHLGLEEGSGLTVYHIIPNSSAAKAGLEKHDILTDLDGKKIGNQQDLREIVRAHEPGDEVVVKYIHKGKVEEKKIILGERDGVQAMRAPGMNPQWMRGNMPEAERKLMQEQMKKHMEQMKLQLEKGGVELDLQGMLDNAQKAGPKAKDGKAFKNGLDFNFGGASITMRDGDGSVTMKTVNGKKDVIVKDKDGKIEFEGPYQTEQDKAAVPDDIRDRLERLNFGEMRDGALRLQIGPGGIMPPEEKPEDEAAE